METDLEHLRDEFLRNGSLHDRSRHAGSTAGPAVEAEVCIAGGGIAGLALAWKLLALGVNVLLLEQGGSEAQPASEGSEICFGLGGSSAVWGGQVLPVHNVEGWPLKLAELTAHTAEIEQMLGVDALPYEAEAFFSHMGERAVTHSTAIPGFVPRVSKFLPFPRRNLGRFLGRHLLRSPGCRVALHTRVLRIEPDRAGRRVEYLVAMGPGGRAVRVFARNFVLAAGTLQSCGLLLASRSVQANGVGNDHGQVGRNVHDHLTATAAVLHGASRVRAVQRMRPWVAGGGLRGTVHSLKLETGRTGSPTGEAAGELPFAMAHIVFDEPEDSALGTLRGLLRRRQRSNGRSPLVTDLRRLPRALGDLQRLYEEAGGEGRRYVSARARVALQLNVAQGVPSAGSIRLEGAPEPNTADGSLAAHLPVARAVLHRRASPADLQEMRRFARFVHRQLAQRGFSQGDGAAWAPWLLEERSPAAADGVDGLSGLDRLGGLDDARHLMGGCAMGSDPRRSVVDGDLRVHGFSNLYVASAAVLPDGRAQLPTWTLLALALRLAEHLRTRAGHGR